MADIDAGDVVFTIRGDASQLEAELERASDGLERVGDEADNAGGGLRGLSSVTRVVSSEFSKGASAVTALTRGIAGFSVALGPAVAIVGALSVAVKLYQADQEEAARVQERSTAIADGLRSANVKLQAAYEDLAVAAGDMSGTELKIARVRKQTFTENLPAVQQLSQALGEQVNKVLEAQQAIDDLNPKQRNYAQLNELLTAGLKAEKEELERLNVKRDELIALIDETTTVRVKEIQLTDASTRATRQQVDAEAELAQLREQAGRDAIAGIIADTQELQRVQNEQAMGSMSAVASFNASMQAQNDAVSAEIQGMADATTRANVQTATDALSVTSGTAMALSREVADTNSKAAKALFRTSQAAALGEIAMNTAVAASKAAAQTGVFAPLAVPAVIALGAAQAGIVLAQKPPIAHIGTGMAGSRDPLAPDERMSGGMRTLRQEATGDGGVANSTGTQLINDVNTGKLSSAPQRLVATIGRSHLDDELFQSGRRGTSRYARTLRTNPHPKPQRGW